MSKQNLERSNWLGVCLLVIGIAYLYRHLHWDFYFLQDFIPHRFLSWPAILMVIGFLLLVFGRTGGIFLMLFGAFFLFTHEFISIMRDFDQWWPIALIIVGVMLLTRGTQHRKVKN